MRDLQTIRELASRPRNAILNSFKDAMHTSFCELSHVSVLFGKFLRKNNTAVPFLAATVVIISAVCMNIWPLLPNVWDIAVKIESRGGGMF